MQNIHQNVTILTTACCPVRREWSHPSARLSPARHWGRSCWAAPQLGTNNLHLQSDQALLHQPKLSSFQLRVCAKRSFLSQPSLCNHQYVEVAWQFFLIKKISIVYSTNRWQYKLRAFFPGHKVNLHFLQLFSIKGGSQQQCQSLYLTQNTEYFNIISIIWKNVFLHTNYHQCIETLAELNLHSWEWVWFEQRPPKGTKQVIWQVHTFSDPRWGWNIWRRIC